MFLILADWLSQWGGVGRGWGAAQKRKHFQCCSGACGWREEQQKHISPFAIQGLGAGAGGPDGRSVFRFLSSVYLAQSASCLFSLTETQMMSIEKTVADVMKYMRWMTKIWSKGLLLCSIVYFTIVFYACSLAVLKGNISAGPCCVFLTRL